MADGPRYDLVTLGETLIRFSPPGMLRFDQTRNFDAGIGGSELNVGCVLARLGRRVAWVSRLPTGPLGRIIDGEARRHGVDTSHITWVDDARQGLMFFEAGPAPRNARVIYDRKNSAAAGMTLGDTDWEALIAGSARVHLSGITPALGASCRELVIAVAALARAAGKPLSYDLNHRATLTTEAEARAVLDRVAPYLDLIVVAERDAQTVLDFRESGARLAEAIAARYGAGMVALTRPPGSDTGDLLLADGVLREAPRYPVEIVDRIGAGDSFVAGILFGLLEADLDLAVRLGAYLGALALATPGDVNFLGPEDLAAFRADTVGRLLR